MAAGKAYEIKLFGAYAMNSLRMEKAYRGWGSELTNEIDMFEAAMDRFIRLDKPDFIGRQASLAAETAWRAHAACLSRRWRRQDSDCAGNEPVYAGDRLVGLDDERRLWSRGREIAGLRLCRPRAGRAGNRIRYSFLGERRKATILRDAAWDAANLRLRA